MAFVHWSSEMETGIKKIDEQHQKLVQLLNDLFDAMNKGKSKDALSIILDELVEYTKVHFGTEERYFRMYEYPKSEAHMKEHTNLATQVIDFQTQFKTGNARVTVQLLNFLKDWLTNHILGSDKEYGPFLKSQGLR